MEYDAQFSVPLIQLLMKEYPSAVIDCGGDDLVGWTDEQREEIKAGIAASGLMYIAAILPFSDIEKTRSHFAARGPSFNLNELLLANPSYWQLANKIFYTEGCDLESVAKAIIDWVLDSTTG